MVTDFECLSEESGAYESVDSSGLYLTPVCTWSYDFDSFICEEISFYIALEICFGTNREDVLGVDIAIDTNSSYDRYGDTCTAIVFLSIRYGCHAIGDITSERCYHIVESDLECREYRFSLGIVGQSYLCIEISVHRRE